LAAVLQVSDEGQHEAELHEVVPEGQVVDCNDQPWSTARASMAPKGTRSARILALAPAAAAATTRRALAAYIVGKREKVVGFVEIWLYIWGKGFFFLFKKTNVEGFQRTTEENEVYIKARGVKSRV